MTTFGRYGAAGAAVFAMWLAAPAPADAQMEERHRVMVTALMPKQGADDDFGKDLAKELRKLINESHTHQPVEEKEIKNAAKQYDIDMEDIDCIVGVQLGTQIRANLVFCGSYTEDEQAKTVALAEMRFQAPGGASFPVPDATWGEKEYREAAQAIYVEFGTYIDQIRRATFCGQYFNSGDYASAEENCLAALALKDDDAQSRYVYAMISMQRGRDAEEAGDAGAAQEFFTTSYVEAKTLLEQDALHEQGLELAGFLAAKLDHPDEARDHYAQFLQLDPGNSTVRMRVAYDLALAGDEYGAMLLIEEGLARDAENVDMLLQHASFAARAAQKNREGAAEDEPLSDEARELYEKVLGSYAGAYEVQGEDMDVVHLRNMIAAYSELGQFAEAVSMAQRVLRTHGEEAQLWSLYADVLKKGGQLDDAIAALDTVEMRDADYPNVKARQGSWLLEADRPRDAVPFLQAAVQKGEQSADAMARLLFADAHRKGVRKDDWAYAINMLEEAKGSFEAAVSEAVAGELDFWHAYSLYQRAKQVSGPETVQSAQRALPMFQSAARLFALPRVAGYARTQPSIALQQLRDATQQYVEIQEALIQRGT